MRVLLPAAVLFATMMLAAGPAAAVQPDEILPDRALEERARTISAELRCLVCQNQSIDDSDAPLARDLRLLVRDRLTRGDSDSAVRDFVVARYGEFVLLKPTLTWATALLWGGPAVILGLGIAALFFARRRAEARDAELTADERTALRKMLDEHRA